MTKFVFIFLCALSLCAPAAFAGVTVKSPANGVTVQGTVPYVASATTSCSKGVASMGIYSAPGVLAYVVNGASLNTNLPLDPGKYDTVVTAWDYCGGAGTMPVSVTVNAGSGVYVKAPANNSTVNSPANFSATATSTCSKGVASMGIYTAPGQLAYVVNGASMNYNLGLSAGKYNAVVEEWDYCGGAATAPVTFTVSSNGKSFTNLQHSGGWSGFGQKAPDFVDCSPSPCDGIVFSATQGVKSPSMSGASMQFYLGGTSVYSDTLWNNHLIGDLSSQGLPDTNHTLVPTLHNFTYDAYFYGTNLELSEALEFDINQFFDNMGFIWGHECRIAGGHEWDVWNNVSSKWTPTGIPCNPVDNAWNHVTIQVQRTSNNQLLFQSITLNGVTSNVNQTFDHGSAPGWWGVTVNYQMDGNSKQNAYSVYLDDFTFGYQ